MAILKPEPNSVNSRIADSRFGRSPKHFMGGKRQVRICTPRGTPYAPTNLMQLGKAHTICILYDSVLAFGTSTPVSMIVVHTNTSISCSRSFRHTSDSSFSAIFHGQNPTQASESAPGFAQRCVRWKLRRYGDNRLAPPRRSSRRMAH